MISYAQNFEDVILHRVFKDRKEGFYIDVGACDPIIDSVTKWFYEEGWSGINIEPNEWFYSKLLADRPRDINLNLAVGERDECRRFHVFEKIGNSTFEQASRDRYVERGYPSTEKTVRVTTLAAICHEYVRSEIDFLKVDCEGWEKFALSGADWERFRPIVVIVEATEPDTTTPSWSGWEGILTESEKYEMVYFDGLNRFYLRREYADLRSHFQVPPNVFDEFKIYTVDRMERASQALQGERNSLAAQVTQAEEKLTRLADLVSLKEAEIENMKVSINQAQKEQEREVARYQNRIADLERERNGLECQLSKTRLWVGRLSQDLAAAGRG